MFILFRKLTARAAGRLRPLVYIYIYVYIYTYILFLSLSKRTARAAGRLRPLLNPSRLYIDIDIHIYLCSYLSIYLNFPHALVGCSVCDTSELWRDAAGLCARVCACAGAAESLHTCIRTARAAGRLRPLLNPSRFYYIDIYVYVYLFVSIDLSLSL